MKIRSMRLLAGLLLILLCARCQKELKIKTEENYVYNAVLNHDEEQQSGLYIIGDSTAVYASLDSTVLDLINRAYGAKLPTTLIDHFKQQNEINYDITTLFDTALESKNMVELKEDGEIKTLSNVYENYPDIRGIYTFSRAGFNATRDMALVYVGVFRQATEGEGGYFILLKEDETWLIHKKVELWSTS